MAKLANSNSLLEPWNGFGFKQITSADYPSVLSNIRINHYLDQPFKKSQMTPERLSDLDRSITRTLNKNPGSFLAYPLEKPETVAGVLIIRINHSSVEPQLTEDKSPLTEQHRKAAKEFQALYNIHKEHGLETYPEIFIVSVDKPYRGKGLGTEMFQRAIVKFKAEGYPLVSSELCTPASRKIGDKLGFKEVSRMYPSEIKTDEGKPVYENVENEEDYSAESILWLK